MVPVTERKNGFSSCLTVWNVLLKADVKWLSLTYFREGRQGWGFQKSKLKMTEKWRALRPEPCVGSRGWLTSLRRGPSAAVRSSSVLQRPGSCRCLSGCPGSKRQSEVNQVAFTEYQQVVQIFTQGEGLTCGIFCGCTSRAKSSKVFTLGWHVLDGVTNTQPANGTQL